MKEIDHIYVLLAALALVLGVYIVLVEIHGTNAKLMDGALILIGGIATAYKSKS